MFFGYFRHDLGTPNPISFYSWRRWGFSVNAMMYTVSYLPRFDAIISFSPFRAICLAIDTDQCISTTIFFRTNAQTYLRASHTIIAMLLFHRKSSAAMCLVYCELCLGRLIVYAYVKAQAIKRKPFNHLNIDMLHFCESIVDLPQKNTCF